MATKDPERIAQILNIFSQATAAVPGIRALSGPARELALGLGQKPDDTGYVQGVSEAIYNAVTPFGYGGHEGQLLDATARIIKNDPGEVARQLTPPAREDAWRLYLGLPQENNTLRPAKYKPAKSKDKNATYYELDPRQFLEVQKGNIGISDSGYIGRNNTFRRLLSSLRDKESLTVSDSTPTEVNVMGNFTLSKGEDEKGKYISYYDKWDLDEPFSKLVQVGKPFEIYGRIYYTEIRGAPFLVEEN